MNHSPTSPASRVRYLLPLLALVAILIFIATYLGIRKSRSDSLELLRRQGTALIESLALSADNAIKANSFFDLLIQEKFADLTSFLENRPDFDYSAEELAEFTLAYDIDAIMVFDSAGVLLNYGTGGPLVDIDFLTESVAGDVNNLVISPPGASDFITATGDSPNEISLFYLQKTYDNRYIIVFSADALFYTSSKRSIGIGFLVRNIAQEVGIEYIVFQSFDGIIFSSRKLDPLLKIDKDPLLTAALESDTALSRLTDFNGREILELARKFSSAEFGEGVFRLGLSLDKYHEIVAGFDRQMIVFSVVLFAGIVLSIMYMVGKEKRRYLTRSLGEVQSLADKVFDSINSGLVVIDRESRVVSVNRQFQETFHATLHTLGSQRWVDLPFQGVVPFGEILLGDKATGEFRTEFADSSGKKYFLVNVARLADYEGKPAGAVAIIYDYTRIRELEETSHRRERLTELGDLAAGVAHEIRNPLNGISIAAQRLLSEFEPTENREEFQRFAGQIRSEANRLNEIVTRFLALARGKGGDAGRIDLSRVTLETIDLVKMGYKSSATQLRLNIEPGLTAFLSEDRYKQMLINLVRNAYEACPASDGTVQVSLEKRDNRLHMTVADNGPGIPEDIRDKIFNPYFSTKEKGTGLGLSIVHQIVTEFGGTIEVVSPPPSAASPLSGAEFRVTLPG